MTDNNSVFVATVEKWVAESSLYLSAIVKESTQDVLEYMRLPKAAGGNMPIDTSFLQNSLQGSKAGVPPIDPKATGEGGPERGNWTQVEALIVGWEMGETLYFGFTASYAAYQNYGWSNFPGNHFVELAVQRWPEYVEKNQRRLAGQIVWGGV